MNSTNVKIERGSNPRFMYRGDGSSEKIDFKRFYLDLHVLMYSNLSHEITFVCVATRTIRTCKFVVRVMMILEQRFEARGLFLCQFFLLLSSVCTCVLRFLQNLFTFDASVFCHHFSFI